MSTTILLIRHGETAWNRNKVFRGVYDIPLNENGRAQAQALARTLATRAIDATYTSPLSRAVETAAIVLEPHEIDAIIHDGLNDFNYGHWTGLSDEEVALRWPGEYRRWTTEPHTLRVPGGNTLQEVFANAFRAVEELVRKHDSQTIAVFAHRVVNKLLVLGMLTLGLERFPFIRQDNCCLNEFHWTGQNYIVTSLNDVGHLKQMKTALLSEDF